MQVCLIVLALYNRITDMIQCLYINPADHIRIHTLERCKIHIDRCLGLCLRSCHLLRIRCTVRDCHLLDMIILVRSLFVFCIDVKKIKSRIAKNCYRYNKNQRQKEVTFLFGLLLLLCVSLVHSYIPFIPELLPVTENL